MPEYGWSRIFLNILGFLIWFKKEKHGWISLAHASICLKYNVKDTYKKTIEVRKHLQDRSAFRAISNVQDGAFVIMFNMVLWTYLGVCICFSIRICQVYARFWICVSMLLNNARICLNMPEAEREIIVQTNYHL